jgi:hypothetical protein
MAVGAGEAVGAIGLSLIAAFAPVEVEVGEIHGDLS